MPKKSKDMVGIKGKSGGKREGSGKPKGLNQKAMSFRVELDLLDYLNSKENKNGFINECIRKEKERE